MRTFGLIGHTLFLIFVPTLCAAAAGGEHPGGFWPQFHGPNRDSMSDETGLLTKWPEGGPKLLWKYSDCGRGYAGVSVAEGRIYTSGDFDDKEFVIGLDLDGKLLWKTQNGEAWRGSTPGSRATPTWSDGLLYHMSPTGRIAALESATGREVWAVDLEQQFGVRHGPWAMAENVLVEGSTVICAPGGDRGRIVALDKKTGKTVWANTTIEDGLAYSSPIIVTHGGVRQLIALLRATVVGVDVKTGRLLWSHPHRNRYNQNATRPLYQDGRVFVTSGHQAGGRLIEISPSGDAARELWFNEEFDNCHGGVLYIDGRLYGSGCRLYHKGLLCVDLKTGKTVYRHEPVGKVSLTHAEGLIYGVDQEGSVRLVKADGREAEIVSQFRIPMDHKDQPLAHPVICGKRLYIRHAQNLFVYDITRGEP